MPLECISGPVSPKNTASWWSEWWTKDLQNLYSLRSSGRYLSILNMDFIGFWLYRYVIFSLKISLNFQRLPQPPPLFTWSIKLSQNFDSFLEFTSNLKMDPPPSLWQLKNRSISYRYHKRSQGAYPPSQLKCLQWWKVDKKAYCFFSFGFF